MKCSQQHVRNPHNGHVWETHVPQTGLHDFSGFLLNPFQNHSTETVKKFNMKRKRSCLTRRSLWYRPSLSSKALVVLYPDKKQIFFISFIANVSFKILTKQVTCRCTFLLLYMVNSLACFYTSKVFLPFFRKIPWQYLEGDRHFLLPDPFPFIINSPQPSALPN